MVEEEALEDTRGKRDGVLGRVVEGVDDGHPGVLAPVRLVHRLPEPRVLMLPVPSRQSSLMNFAGVGNLYVSKFKYNMHQFFEQAIFAVRGDT